MQIHVKSHLFGLVGFTLACLLSAACVYLSRGSAGDPIVPAGPDVPRRVGDTVRQIDSAQSAVKLLLEPSEVLARPEEPVPIRAVIRNESSDAVLLVLPGDGSTEGWRTPILDWSIAKAGSHYPPGEAFPRWRMCGNVNGLQRDDVFRLEPHDEIELKDWVYVYAPARPGRYKVRLTYVNDPLLPFKGIGGDDADAIELVRASTKCELVSNEVAVRVVK